jgi:hypothetical protein
VTDPSAFLAVAGCVILIASAVSWAGERFVLPAIPALALNLGISPAHARIFGRIQQVQWHVWTVGFAVLMVAAAASTWLAWDMPPFALLIASLASSLGGCALGIYPALRLIPHLPRGRGWTVLLWVALLATVVFAWRMASI